MRICFALGCICLFIAILATSGCGPTTTQGIAIETGQCQESVMAQNMTGNPCLPNSTQAVPHVPVWGQFAQTWPAAGAPVGTGTQFGIAANGQPSPVYTGNDGILFLGNGEGNALWNMFALEYSYCGSSISVAPNGNAPAYNINDEGQVPWNNGNYYEYEWQGVPILPSTYISPTAGKPGSITNFAILGCPTYTPLQPATTRFAVAGSLPGTLTLGSNTGFTTTYGMPLLYVYDAANGLPNLVTTETATSVSADGTEATFPFPNLPQNGYSLAVQNQIPVTPGDTPAGTNVLSIASSQTIAGNPFGVAAGGIYTGSTYQPIPIVSLYSQGQVMIGNTPVTVGANPTAVAVYPAPAEGSYSYSTAERAVVANSGSNTISILDILNDAVVSTITVGNQPVALAVSSDGSTAYVANYTDGTVSRVNLTTYTQTGTVAVGGNPTSVALTSAGTLWVGGPRFLMQVNAQTMAVTAGQITNKTIVALGYTDAYSELVATTTDIGGKVYVDEVAPASVQTGTQYTPTASQVVSSLGTYGKRERGQLILIKGFTGTVATGSVPINTAQPGGSPLVVQDGWAVVSATPTGFTISDASGNIVLASETTPSPVTGIAVNTNLNAAYLVMPDSNTLLTVPLPGVPASAPSVTATPSNSGSYTFEGSQEIDFTISLYDSTPGATIFYQTSCPGSGGSDGSGGSFDVYFQVYSGCNPSGTMYAQAPGLLPSATVSMDFP